MGQIRLNVSGLGDAQALIDRVVDTENSALAEKALQAGADVILNAERDLAPQRSDGRHIKNRLETRIKKGANGVEALVGVWDEPIAYFVEYGHAGPKPAPPHPYMAPAAEQAEDAAIAAVVAVLKGGL